MKKRNETLVGYAFVAPALIVFVALVAFPLLFSIFLSFTEWNFLSGWDNIKFAGLNNFRKLLADNGFRWGLKNTFIYTAAVVPASIIIALVLAYLLNDKVYTKKTLRLCFFIPYISNAVALAAVFKAMFREDGVINYILMRFFGMQEAIRWFTNSQFNNVPRELYEAAELDGATPWKKFWRITFPLISPTTFYLVVVQLIAVFKIFSAIDVMNFGQTAYSNTSIVVEIYKNAFQHYNFGYASAESLVLLVIIIIATAINFIGQKKWVHY